MIYKIWFRISSLFNRLLIFLCSLGIFILPSRGSVSVTKLFGKNFFSFALASSSPASVSLPSTKPETQGDKFILHLEKSENRTSEAIVKALLPKKGKINTTYNYEEGFVAVSFYKNKFWLGTLHLRLNEFEPKNSTEYSRGKKSRFELPFLDETPLEVEYLGPNIEIKKDGKVWKYADSRWMKSDF